MIKLLVIWDLHWLNIWKDLVKKYEFDKVIFLGDYVDSFNVPDDGMVNNLQEIIEYKKENMNKVTLLWGNHDLQYIDKKFRCSGYRGTIADTLESIYKPNKKLFKVVHTEWKYIFSHAGFTENWVNENFPAWWIEEEINSLPDCLNQVSSERWGYSNCGSPVWAWRDEMEREGECGVIMNEDGKIYEPIQVVWHTAVPHIIEKQNVIFCDNLEYWNEVPLVLNIE